MVLEGFDIFSSQFQFSIGYKKREKKSFIGGILSFITIIFSILYFFYLIFLYVENRIEPKYKMQNFIQDGELQLKPENNFYAFNFFLSGNKTIDMLEQETGQKYLVYFPTFQVFSKNDLKYINLTVFDCIDTQLKGMKCLDFSAINDYSLTIDVHQQLYYEIVFLIYRCSDVDVFKQDIPNNCASNDKIDELINNRQHYLQFLMKTSQFNTSSEQIEVRYKQYTSHLKSNEMLFSVIKNVKQVTNIKRGPILQSSYTFSSPIDYIKEERSFNKQSLYKDTGLNLINQITITIDESVQQIQIQYATFMEILAIFNSSLTFIIGFGLIARYYSRQLIQQDIILLIMKELYSKTYIKWLDQASIFNTPKSSKNTNFIQSSQQSNLQKQSVNSDKININSNQKLMIDQQPSLLRMNNQQENIINISDIKPGLVTNKRIEQKLDNSISKQKQQRSINACNSKKIIMKGSPQQTNQQNKMQFPFDGKVQSLQISQLNASHHQEEDQKIVEMEQQKSPQIIIDKSNKNVKKVQKEQKYIEENNINFDDFKTNIQNTIQIFKAVQSEFYFQKMKTLFSYFSCKKKKFQKEQKKTYEMEYSYLQNEALKQVNIMNLFKEIITLKKAIMILLNKEQFAALNFIGCQIINDKTDNSLEDNSEVDIAARKQISLDKTIYKDLIITNSIQTPQSFYQKRFLIPKSHQDSLQTYKVDSPNVSPNLPCHKGGLSQNEFSSNDQEESYLDQMNNINNSEFKQIQYMKLFLKKYQNVRPISEIDKRILSSLII